MYAKRRTKEGTLKGFAAFCMTPIGDAFRHRIVSRLSPPLVREHRGEIPVLVLLKNSAASTQLK